MYRLILDLSEVWALFIPLTVYYLKKEKNSYLPLIIAYLYCALLLNTVADIIQKISNPSLPFLFRYNNWLYNIHSIVRTILFLLFFKSIITKFKFFKPNLVMGLFATVVIATFYKYENFFYINPRLFAFEGIILLFCCMLFFLQRMRDEELYLDFDAQLIITTGLMIYEGINFFIFLFYKILTQKERSFAINIWDVHNISFIIFCVFIAYAFYGRKSINSSLKQSNHLKNPISNIS